MEKTDKQKKKDGTLESTLQASEVLAIDVSEDMIPRNWARRMAATRARFGHDRPTTRGTSRTHYRFTLSPDPGDACSLETLRSCARAWAEECFRSGGRLHEYAILYRFEDGALRADVIVNVSDKASGRKLRIWGGANVELAVSLREIARDLGLGPIDMKSEHCHGSLEEGDLR